MEGPVHAVCLQVPHLCLQFPFSLMPARAVLMHSSSFSEAAGLHFLIGTEGKTDREEFERCLSLMAAVYHTESGRLCGPPPSDSDEASWRATQAQIPTFKAGSPAAA